MQIVIDIPEEDYIRLRDEGMFGNVTTFKRAVREGIPLEKEPCENAISRDKAIVQLSHLLSDWDDDWNVAIRKCIETLKIVKPVKPTEKVGHWIRVDKEKLRCSECEVIHLIAQYPNGKIDWCPNCGAKMQEVKE